MGSIPVVVEQAEKKYRPKANSGNMCVFRQEERGRKERRVREAETMEENLPLG